MSASEYLFVYGSLRQQADGSQHPLLQHTAEFCSLGTLPGQLYEVAGYPGAITNPKATTSLIYGEIYLIRDAKQLFIQLDNYEECSAAYPLPHEYRRCQLPVTLTNSQQLTAWVYLYNWSVDGLELIIGGDYQNQLSPK